MQNIVLSGGSTLYKKFNLRLETDIQARVDARIRENMLRVTARTGSAPVRALRLLGRVLWPVLEQRSFFQALHRAGVCSGHWGTFCVSTFHMCPRRGTSLLTK